MKKNYNDVFKNKVLLITGGTGSFGIAVLNRFLNTNIKEIRIFSRDELKQDNMRHEYQNDKIKYFIGDVKEKSTIMESMKGVDYVFHAAALKQVPSCEFFPLEAVKTNVIGTDNVLSAAIDCEVKKVICLSTDKAAYPINAMGKSKALMESVAKAKARTCNSKKTTICVTRYGNVMCSRGSVIPLFINQIKNNLPLTVTVKEMTRFIMSLEEAVELVLFAFNNADNGDIFVMKAPACTIEVLANAVKELFNAKNDIKVIGIRHGEKMYETLLTDEECNNAIDLGNYFKVTADNRDLNYDKYVNKGNVKKAKIEKFDSDHTKLLTVEEVKKKLLKLDYIKKELENFNRG